MIESSEATEEILNRFPKRDRFEGEARKKISLFIGRDKKLNPAFKLGLKSYWLTQDERGLAQEKNRGKRIIDPSEQKAIQAAQAELSEKLAEAIRESGPIALEAFRAAQSLHPIALGEDVSFSAEELNKLVDGLADDLARSMGEVATVADQEVEEDVRQTVEVFATNESLEQALWAGIQSHLVGQEEIRLTHEKRKRIADPVEQGAIEAAKVQIQNSLREAKRQEKLAQKAFKAGQKLARRTLAGEEMISLATLRALIKKTIEEIPGRIEQARA